MVAFAANSILGRAALKPDLEVSDQTDPATYTALRILSGAVVLAAIQWFRPGSSGSSITSIFWPPEDIGFARRLAAPFLLIVYAGGFSFAYLGLDAASGTLILFAMVQITMVAVGIIKKEYPNALEIAGLSIASAGLVYLVLPNLQTPLIKESILMAIAGIAWGGYSILGKSSKDPIANTATNFVLATPVALLLPLIAWNQFSISSTGVQLALLSGGLASGLGYVVWYSVLPFLRSAQAAAVQLSVPILAALGGVLLVGDDLKTRTFVAGMFILLGIGLTIKWKKKQPGAK